MSFTKNIGVIRMSEASNSDENDKWSCAICGDEFEGHGNNPSPIEGEKCCGACNKQVVLPLRIKINQLKKRVGNGERCDECDGTGFKGSMVDKCEECNGTGFERGLW